LVCCKDCAGGIAAGHEVLQKVWDANYMSRGARGQVEAWQRGIVAREHFGLTCAVCTVPLHVDFYGLSTAVSNDETKVKKKLEKKTGDIIQEGMRP
jgi:hypothetical protein